MSSDIRYFTKEKQFQPLPEVRVSDEMYSNVALERCYVKNGNGFDNKMGAL